ncbi:DoxX family protein [Rhodohalobacter sulfatireducens]|uniref:DoxX family protein n=1 Tax=Rhodohalobacter sulfatireducens TaxID=2911366 RepID=A0ABS9KGP5_9BACT|nr:DoxX family protein [Rhodohalobacter sulfatireducens]MCG2590008.1 DoxX family protein [Rhodohalobacter sulfatireducens]
MFERFLKKCRQIRSKDQLISFIEKLERVGKAFFAPVEIKSIFINVLIAIPRIAFGVILISDVWRRKIGMPVNETSGYVTQLMEIPGWPDWIDKNMILWIDIVEKIGQGSVFIFGFNTRLVAFAMIWTSLERWFNEFMIETLVLPLYILFISVCFYSLILGSGKIGIDYWISRKLDSKRNKNS